VPFRRPANGWRFSIRRGRTVEPLVSRTCLGAKDRAFGRKVLRSHGLPYLSCAHDEDQPNCCGWTESPRIEVERECFSIRLHSAEVSSVGAEFKRLAVVCRHPVGVPVNKPGLLDRSQLPPLVDVRGTQDPSDDVIGCTTCHYVHTSKNSFLLRWGLTELSAACLKCHADVAPSAPGNVKNFMTRR
jgi:predicted CXXCH cytochrome family protein